MTRQYIYPSSADNRIAATAEATSTFAGGTAPGGLWRVYVILLGLVLLTPVLLGGISAGGRQNAAAITDYR